MCTTTNKMDWFVKMYNEKTLDYTVAKTKANFGTIVMPTGTGKSGKVYEDICHVLDTHKAGEKVVINISCPILKLTQQFINDFFAVASQIYGNNNKFTFFINSSDNGKMYDDAASSMGIDVESFKDFDAKFVNNSMKDIAIVASCHKSLHKFINKIAKCQSAHMNIISYIDEAHLIDIHKNNEDEDMVYVDLNKLCENSTKVYAFTATPDPEVVKLINEHNLTLTGTSKYIYHMFPVDAINQNMILPPYVNYIQTNTDGIVAKMLKKIMADAKAKNPYIAHKILITLKSSEELKAMRKELESMNFKVFSTCSKFGYGNGADEADEKYSDVTDFINDVDSYNGDCFVLHIRQLIQGIDIKSLTDCVIWSASNGNQKEYRHLIQIIGRCLRPLAGERGVDKSNRVKKVGGVYFISPSDNDEVSNNIENFICRYYGFDNIDFAVKSYTTTGKKTEDMFEHLKDIKFRSGWDNPMVKDLLVNIENYIRTKVVPKVALYKKLRKEVSIDAEKIIAMYDVMGKEWNTSELLDNRDLLNKVRELFDKYTNNSENKLF